MAPRRSRSTERGRSRRVLSQNFLVDRAAVARLVRAADPDPAGLLLEVGAGRGQLTRPLASRCARLTAYEVDPVAGRELAAVCARLPTVEHRQADFLAAEPPPEPFAVVGNIPWSLTSAVVRWCLAAPRLRSATLLTQLEYARRRSGDYGRWTRLTVETWPEVGWRLAAGGAGAPYGVPAGTGRGCGDPADRAAGGTAAAAGGLAGVPTAGGAGFRGCRRIARRDPTPAPPTSPGGGGAARHAGRATRVAPDTPVGYVWPEQWLVLFRLLHAR